MSASFLLELKNMTYGFERRPDFLKPVSVGIAGGQLWGIIGPNGAGKSTLLRLMAGLIHPRGGSICLDGRALGSYSPRERAQRIAFLPQQMPRDLPVSVRQVALLGRFPHRSFGLFESAEDFRIADDALRLTQTHEFADRALNTLSGGEAQRVHIAAALAQQPTILLLDEPTAALDLRHQLQLFELLRDLTGKGFAIVAVTHDLNLAARYCSQILVLDDGVPVAWGTPDEIMTPEKLGPVFRIELEKTHLRSGGDWLAAIRERASGGRSVA